MPNSQHVEGTAADITYDDIDVDYLAQIAEECGPMELVAIIIRTSYTLTCVDMTHAGMILTK